jgi:ribosomal protein L11 methyltransferase
MRARFERIRLGAEPGEVAERAAAEAFDAGASGIEERELEGDAGRIELWVYAPEPAAGAVLAALERIASGAGAALEVRGREPAPDDDWSVRWREGLGVVRISPRLAVRPPFVPDDPQGSAALVIDPGQAFGTGGHASTRLALTLLDGLAGAGLRGARVLDVGTGSGVLALAALLLGAESAVGFDLDPVAAREARANAAANGLAGRARLFAGPIAALRAPSFDLVLANLLRRELLPILGALADALRPGGRAVLAGLLASEREETTRALAEAGFSVESALEERDAGGDAWLGLVIRRPAPSASRRGPRAG